MAVAKKKLIIIGLLVVAALLAIIKFVFLGGAKEEVAEVKTGTTEMTGSQESQAMPATGSDSMMMNESAKTAKTASVTEHYGNPAGGDDVSFTLGVDDQGVITEAKTGVMATNEFSKMRQESFAQALPGVIVGKKLADLTRIDRVGGSSLTTGAFNAALPELKSKL